MGDRALTSGVFFCFVLFLLLCVHVHTQHDHIYYKIIQTGNSHKKSYH